MAICKKCSEELADGKGFCSGCGSKVEVTAEAIIEKPKHCVECGSLIDVGKDFCGECGANSNQTDESYQKPDITSAQTEIKKYKFYRLGYRGRLGLGGAFGMKNYCTVSTIYSTTLKLLVCRGFTVGGDPLKPQVKEVSYSEINSVNIKKKISYAWLTNAIFCGGLGFLNPLFFIGSALSIFNMFGRKVTINLKYEDTFVILTDSTTEADEFVGLVVNELKKEKT